MSFGQEKQGHDALQQKLRDKRFEQVEREARFNKLNWMATVAACVLSVASLGYVGIQYLPESEEPVELAVNEPVDKNNLDDRQMRKTSFFGFSSISQASFKSKKSNSGSNSEQLTIDQLPWFVQSDARRTVRNAARSKGKSKRDCKDGGDAAIAENSKRMKKAQEEATKFLETNNPFAAVSMVRNLRQGAFAAVTAMGCSTAGTNKLGKKSK